MNPTALVSSLRHSLSNAQARAAQAAAQQPYSSRDRAGSPQCSEDVETPSAFSRAHPEYPQPVLRVVPQWFRAAVAAGFTVIACAISIGLERRSGGRLVDSSVSLAMLVGWLALSAVTYVVLYVTRYGFDRRRIARAFDALSLTKAIAVTGGRVRLRGRVRVEQGADRVPGVAAYETRGWLSRTCPEAYSMSTAAAGQVVSCGGSFTLDDSSGVRVRVPSTFVRVIEGHRDERSVDEVRFLRDGDEVELVGDAQVRIAASEQGFRGTTYELVFEGTPESPVLLRLAEPRSSERAGAVATRPSPAPVSLPVRVGASLDAAPASRETPHALAPITLACDEDTLVDRAPLAPRDGETRGASRRAA